MSTKLKEFEAQTPAKHDYWIDYWIYYAKAIIWNQTLPLNDYELKIKDKQQCNSWPYTEIIKYFEKFAAIKVT